MIFRLVFVALFIRLSLAARAICTYADVHELSSALQLFSTHREFVRRIDESFYILFVNENALDIALQQASTLIYPVTAIAVPHDMYPDAPHELLGFLSLLPKIVDHKQITDVLLLRPNVIVMSDPFSFSSQISSPAFYCSMAAQSNNCDMNALIFRDVSVLSALSQSSMYDSIESVANYVNVSILRLPGAYTSQQPNMTSHLPLLLSRESIALITHPHASDRYAIVNILNPEEDPCITPVIRCGLQVPSSSTNVTPLLHAFSNRLHDPHVCRRLLKCANMFASSISYRPQDYNGYFRLVTPVTSYHSGHGSCFLNWTHGPYREDIDSYVLFGDLHCDLLSHVSVAESLMLRIDINGAILSVPIRDAHVQFSFEIHALLLDGYTRAVLHSHLISNDSLLAIFSTDVVFPNVELLHPHLVREIGGDVRNNFQVSLYAVERNSSTYAVVFNNLSPFLRSATSLRHIFKDQAAPPYVLVTGMFHSGTTILQKLISNHPQADFIGVEMLPRSFMVDPMKEHAIFKLPWLYWDAVLDPVLRHDDWKVVVIVRNLYDVLGSILSSQNLTEDEAVESIALHSRLWFSSYVNAVLLKAYPSRAIIVRYEDLFDENHSYIRGIYEFLGMKFMPEFLTDNESFQAKHFNGFVLDNQIPYETYRPGNKHRLHQINGKFIPRINTWMQCKYASIIEKSVRKSPQYVSALIYFGYDIY